MRAAANLFRSPRLHADDQALRDVVWRQQMRPHLTRQHRVQPVGLLIGPSAPVGQLVRGQIQPPVRYRGAHTGNQASQVVRLGQQPPAFDQGRDPIGVGLVQALLTLALRLDTLALGLLLELAKMLTIGPFALDERPAEISAILASSFPVPLSCQDDDPAVSFNTAEAERFGSGRGAL